ncbi:MAG: bifunctional metallophosphatase/5'-nucleotidase, partial [Eubacteriales bacterium]|nr:bifunctional metallophosphatase/5'-nucleotidase [Eubacteriales bacterium]
MPAKLTIYYTSDTHGYLYPTNFVDTQPRPMGLLGMAFPKDGNTLVIDGGDTLQGSPLAYYCHA